MAYVGIVLVSHSSKVVEGIKELSSVKWCRMCPVEIAGGTEEDLSVQVLRKSTGSEYAINGKGVIIFYDIGSAKMNAEIAWKCRNREY